MNQPENALDRLMSRAKPKVPPRSDVVDETIRLDIKTQRHQDIKLLSDQESQESQESTNASPTKDSTKEVSLVEESISKDIKTSLRQDLQTSSNSDIFETARNTIRLEVTVDQALRRLCTEERITKETWFEAAYLYLSEQPEAMDEVARLAQARLNQRKQIADYRRAVAMQKRVFGDDIDTYT